MTVINIAIGTSIGASQVLLLATVIPFTFHVVEELLSLGAVIMCSRMSSPIANQEKTHDHSTQMSQMSHVVTRRCHGRKEFYSRIDHHKPLGFYGHRNGDNEKFLIGKYHAESQQNGINGTRSTHCCPVVEHRT